MDWFERVTGFRETTHDETRAKLAVEGQQLKSLVNGRAYGIGKLELVSLKELRERAQAVQVPRGRLRVELVTGDIRPMHCLQDNAGALFQVASQFNLLEMTGPSVAPEDGVTRYQFDRTQGPACAIAAGAATIYRNYFVPIGQQIGQTRHKQLDGLAELGNALATRLNCPVGKLWAMQNGYAMCTGSGLALIAKYLGSCSGKHVDDLRDLLSVGLHWDVEVTDGDTETRPKVSQAFCSALPVSYSVDSPNWQTFASLVLEAAYEATIWAAALNTQRDASNVVLLTTLGGGAFGNAEGWIIGAMRRALRIAHDLDLNVKLVSYGPPTAAMKQIAVES